MADTHSSLGENVVSQELLEFVFGLEMQKKNEIFKGSDFSILILCGTGAND